MNNPTLAMIFSSMTVAHRIRLSSDAGIVFKPDPQTQRTRQRRVRVNEKARQSAGFARR